jgi:hypothetical protein
MKIYHLVQKLLLSDKVVDEKTVRETDSMAILQASRSLFKEVGLKSAYAQVLPQA